MTPDLELSPPWNPEAEASVIGGLLIDPTAFDRMGPLTDGDFFARHHRLVFQAVADMIERGLPVDPVTVAEQLEANGGLDDAGGIRAVVECAQSTPSAANIKRYAEIVRERSRERQLLAALADATAAVYARQGVEAALGVIETASSDLAGTRTGDVQPVRALLDEFRERMALRASGALVGTPTMFEDLDAKLGGLKPGQLVILAARPAMGKSALATQIAHRNARNGRAVAFFTLEMSSGEVLDRLVALEAGLPLGEVTSGRPRSPAYVDSAVSSIRRWPLHIDDTPALSVREIRRRARALHRRAPLSLVVIDYMQLIPADGETRNLAVEAISRGLKALAKELGVPVLALSQLSRALEARTDKRPVLSDLRDSGGIEQDADVVLMLHREEVYRSDPGEWRGVAELLVRKNRQGPTGDVLLTWRAEHAAFESFLGARPSNVRPIRQSRGFDD